MNTIRSMVLVSSDAMSMDAGAQEVFTRLQNEIHSFNLEKEVSVSMVSDIGRHDSVPMVIVYPEATLYGPVRPDDVHFLVEEHLYKGRIAAGLQAPVKELTGKIAWLSSRKGTLPAEQRIVLERAGVIDPTSLDDYILHDGYQALGNGPHQHVSPGCYCGSGEIRSARARGGWFPHRYQMEIRFPYRRSKEVRGL